MSSHFEYSAFHSMMAASRKTAMASQLSRITVNPEICGGRPTLRNMRIRVADVLDLLAAGESRAAILADYPYLQDEDISAALEYAAVSASHRVIAVEWR